jgi:hypothetical protein
MSYSFFESPVCRQRKLREKIQAGIHSERVRYNRRWRRAFYSALATGFVFGVMVGMMF